jgi:hypothetical protein
MEPQTTDKRIIPPAVAPRTGREDLQRILRRQMRVMSPALEAKLAELVSQKQAAPKTEG